MLRWLGLASLTFSVACSGGGSNVDLATGDPADPVTVTRDCRGAPADPVHLASPTVEGALLRVKVEYGGGCEPHVFAACWDGLIRETAPPRTTLSVHHDGNGDACDALISHDVLIDVSELGLEIGAASIADPAGRIELVGR
jgi:hypothetical protein